MSPQIRKNIMKDNDGYVYVGLSRCESFDHFFVKQCYHCYKFNHFADECPDKDMPATCGKCAERHKRKDCNCRDGQLAPHFMGRSVRAPHTNIINLKTSWRTTYETTRDLETLGKFKEVVGNTFTIWKIVDPKRNVEGRTQRRNYTSQK